MRSLVLALALVLSSVAAEAQIITPPSGSSYDGGAVTNPFLAPNGTSALPGYGWATTAGMGWALVPGSGPGYNTLEHYTPASPGVVAGRTYYEYRYDDGIGAERYYWTWENVNGQRIMRLSTNDLYPTTQFELLATDAATGGIYMQVQAGDFQTPGQSIQFLSVTDGEYNKLRFSTTDVANDGIDVVSYIEFYDNSGADYLRLTGRAPTGQKDIYIPDADGDIMLSVCPGCSAAGNYPEGPNSVWGATNALTFEGGVADGAEISLTAAEPTSFSKTAQLPDRTGFIDVLASVNYRTISQDLGGNDNDPHDTDAIWGVNGDLYWEGTANTFETSLVVTDPTADNTITVPDASGTVSLEWTYVQQAVTKEVLGTTPEDTDLTFTPAANTVYEVEWFILLQSSLASSGARPKLIWPTAGAVYGGVESTIGGSPQVVSAYSNIAVNVDTVIQVGGSDTIIWEVGTATGLIGMDGSAAGPFKVQLQAENGLETARLRAGSYLKYRAIP